MKDIFRHKTTLAEEVSESSTKKVRAARQKSERNYHEEDDEIVPPQLCEKIYHQAKAQVEELKQTPTNDAISSTDPSLFLTRSLKTSLAKLESEDESVEEEMEDLTERENPGPLFSDIVFEKVEKLKEKKNEHIDPKIIKMYEGVGEIFSRLTHGKIPQAFRAIPFLANWEEVLYLTRPDQWTPHAFLASTKIFLNVNPKAAQKYMSRILLPHFRQEIERKNKLHFALYEALKYCCQKASAFYKGLILPLCKSGTCSVREAVVFSSVIKKQSLPVHHSAAALLCLAEMEFSGPTCFFIKTVIEKNYGLPFKALDGLVEHFMRFEFEHQTLPAIWYQCLLSFVQKYKKRMKKEDLEDLRRLTKRKHHHLISLEIYREIDSVLNEGQDISMKDNKDLTENMNIDI